MIVMKELDGKRAERFAKKQLAEQCFAPFASDGKNTKAVLAEIYGWLTMMEITDCRDKLVKWRRDLRAARYLDWKEQQASATP